MNSNTIWKFLLSTLGYITLIYIPAFFTVITIVDASFYSYNLVVGLLITLILCAVCIAIMFAKDIYDLHKKITLEKKLKVRHGKQTIFIEYAAISYFYSLDKIVYLVKTDGTSLITDFTLNELEINLDNHSFFRANRKTLLHYTAVDKIQNIENGKLSLQLTPPLFSKEQSTITISRYKKQGFEDWLNEKTATLLPFG